MHTFLRFAAALAALGLAACSGEEGLSSSEEEAALAAQTADPDAPPKAGEGPGAATRVEPQPADRRALLEDADIVPSGSEGFQPPSLDALRTFQRGFERLLSRPSEPVPELDAVGYAVSYLRDTREGGTYALLREREPRGGGTYVVNLAPARDVWFEAPHADFDTGTLAESAQLFLQLGARALLVTGSHRCANARPTPCSTGATQVCGGQIRESDSAHFQDSFFMAAHRAARGVSVSGTAVSVHGMAATPGELGTVSDGTDLPRPSSLSVRIRDALNTAFSGAGRALSCNDPADAEHARLCGTTNVQGRFDNGSSDACQAKATGGLDRFIHLEQAPLLRDPMQAGRVAQALSTALPCTLSRAGLGC